MHKVRLRDVDCTHGYEAHKVDGSRSKRVIWSIFHFNRTLLHVRELSYFCKFCVDGRNGPCNNCTHIQPWDVVALKPCSPINAKCDLKVDDMWEVSQDGKLLTTCLEVGDYFVIVTNDDIKKSSVGF